MPGTADTRPNLTSARIPSGIERLAPILAGAGVAFGIHFRDFFPDGVAELTLLTALAIQAFSGFRIRISSVILLTLFPIAVLLAVAVSGAEPAAWHYCSMILFGATSALTLASLRSSRLALAGKVFVIISAAVAAVSILGLVLFTWDINVLNITTHGAPSYARSEGFIEGPNYFAISMLFALMVSVALNRYLQWGTALSALLMVGVLASGSRAALIAMIVFGITLLIGDRTARPNVTRAGLLGILGGVLMYATMASASVVTILSNRFLDSTGGGSARLAELANALSGAHGAVDVMGPGRANYAEHGIAPHNAYITVLFDYGFLGLIAFVLPMALTIVFFGSNIRTRGAFPFAIGVSIAVVSIFNDYHFVREWWLAWGLAWLIYGISPAFAKTEP